MSISDPQIDTSAASAKNSMLSLFDMREKKPFDGLIEFIESNIALPHLPMRNLNDNVYYLNILNDALRSSAGHSSNYVSKSASSNSTSSKFADQQLFKSDSRYYEQIIFKTKQVPTRSNWHDFFNGVIWCQFPKTKQTFNALHIAEIGLQGSTKRTSVRDKLTHFDECGVVLFTTQSDVKAQMENHQWRALFVENAGSWHQQTLPVIFGHALWEMLLKPFIGLTAKATVIEVTQDTLFSLQSQLYKPEFYAQCDELLNDHINAKQLASLKKPWLPLPLLGIPHWSPFPQTELFYQNQQYFMPKKS